MYTQFLQCSTQLHYIKPILNKTTIYGIQDTMKNVIATSMLYLALSILRTHTTH